MLGSGYRHIEPSPILQQLAKSSVLIAPDEGHQDEALVPALVFVHCVNLDPPDRRSGQKVIDGPQLLPVRRDDADVAGAAASLNKK